MNRRLKVLVLLLLMAVLLLSAAIAGMAFSGYGTKKEVNDPQEPEPAASVTLFVGQNGLWGARAANGRILIEPAWYYLRAMSDTVLIARRSGGASDNFGLIRISGEQLVPFLYSSFETKGADFWVAALKEDGRQKYHIYRADGTRLTNESWDYVDYSDGNLTVTLNGSRYSGKISGVTHRITWTDIHEEFPVSHFKLTVDLNTNLLRQMPSTDTVHQIGEAAASYLEYLFVTRENAGNISTEDTADAHAYEGCQLKNAEISRITALETEGYPKYLVQMQVQYQTLNENGKPELVRSAFLLTMGRNATGEFEYTGFSDVQMKAKSGMVSEG